VVSRPVGKYLKIGGTCRSSSVILASLSWEITAVSERAMFVAYNASQGGCEHKQTISYDSRSSPLETYLQ